MGVVWRAKPEDLFLTRAGRLEVLDFGIAKALRPDTGHASTAYGTILGTLAYMAPEQFLAGRARRSSARC